MPFWESISMLLSMVFSLLLVLALAWIVLRYMGKRGAGSAGAAGSIKVLDRVSVGREQSILLVKAGSKTLLVALSAQGACALCEFDENEVFEQAVSTPPDFSSIMKKAVGKWPFKGEKEEDKPDEK